MPRPQQQQQLQKCQHSDVKKIAFVHDEQVLICLNCCTHLPKHCWEDWAGATAPSCCDAGCLVGGYVVPGGWWGPASSPNNRQIQHPRHAASKSPAPQPAPKLTKKHHSAALEILIDLADRYHFAECEKNNATETFARMCCQLCKNYKQSVSLALACLYLACNKSRKASYLVEPLRDVIGIRDFWSMWRKVENYRSSLETFSFFDRDQEEYSRMWRVNKQSLSKIMTFRDFMSLADSAGVVQVGLGKQKRTLFAALLYVWGLNNSRKLSRRQAAAVADVSPSAVCRLARELAQMKGVKPPKKSDQ